MKPLRVLVVDEDPVTLDVLRRELSLHGHNVTTNDRAVVDASQPMDLLILGAGTAGAFAFLNKLRAENGEQLPVVLMGVSGLRDKILGLQLGVSDFIQKPVFVEELLRAVARAAGRRDRPSDVGAEQARLVGSLLDFPPKELLVGIAGTKKAARLDVRSVERSVTVYFLDGRVVHAESGPLVGEEALYRLIGWQRGAYTAHFDVAPPEISIDQPLMTLIDTGLKRAEERAEVAVQLPPMSARLALREAPGAGPLPRELEDLAHLLDGDRTVAELLDASPFEDLSTLRLLLRLQTEGRCEVVSSRTPAEGSTTSDRAAMPLSEGSKDLHATRILASFGHAEPDAHDDRPTSRPSVSYVGPVEAPAQRAPERAPSRVPTERPPPFRAPGAGRDDGARAPERDDEAQSRHSRPSGTRMSEFRDPAASPSPWIDGEEARITHPLPGRQRRVGILIGGILLGASALWAVGMWRRAASPSGSAGGEATSSEPNPLRASSTAEPTKNISAKRVDAAAVASGHSGAPAIGQSIAQEAALDATPSVSAGAPALEPASRSDKVVKIPEVATKGLARADGVPPVRASVGAAAILKALEEGRSQEALSMAKEWTSRAPGSAAAWHLRGAAEQAAGKSGASSYAKCAELALAGSGLARECRALSGGASE